MPSAGQLVGMISVLPRGICEATARSGANAQIKQTQMAAAQADTAQKNARALKDLGSTDQSQLQALAEQMTGAGV